jgi:hypothetical protein
MKTTDRVLFSIVLGIVLLIAVALVVTLMRSEPTYQAENTPEGVAHNYLLALQKEENERAYGYLSPTLKDYPASVKEFIEDIDNYSWRFDRDRNKSIKSAKITANRATVTVRESRFRGGDLFDSGQSTSVFKMELYLEDSEWKIVYSSYYFARCWDQEKGCE